MLYNHLRQLVRDATPGEPSLCPLCDAGLIARRGEIVVWHWAHRAKRSGTCPHQETDWHLAWKAAYVRFPAWEVERRITIGETVYVLDAVNLNTGRVREFVHSLSPYYVGKHRALLAAGYDVTWIMHGEPFFSTKGHFIRKGGIRRLLRPKAQELADALGDRLLVQVGDQLYRHWRERIYYPTERLHHGIGAFLAERSRSEKAPA